MGLRGVRCGAFEAKSSSSKGKQKALPVIDNAKEGWESEGPWP